MGRGLIAIAAWLLAACADGPESLKGIDDPDKIPDHPLRGRIGDLPFEAGTTFTVTGMDTRKLYLWIIDRSGDGQCHTPNGPDPVPAIFAFHTSATGAEKTEVDLGVYVTARDRPWVTFDGWVVYDVVTEDRQVEGRLSARAKGEDGEYVAWAEGAFASAPCD